MSRHGSIGRFSGRSLIMISGETKPLPRLRTRPLGTRNTRPVRKQAVCSGDFLAFSQ
ncbi:hypothetical protein GA0061098_10511 [Bradyrhizobium shewense]|uniref:Uncharacterized protein n=1 Tax=Bradyrhizobium shewense TaxID=1761772 RepID=A0A1C3XU22_9BRAD|nr:hypothetical protein GA0061098_10511 [Bradyrhizobium shewense]